MFNFDFNFSGLSSLFRWRLKPQDAPPGSSPTESYLEKLLKYVPGDINAGFVALSGILTQSAAAVPWWLNWAVFGSLLLLTPFYVCYLKTSPPGMTSNKIFHWVTACVAFTAWVFALGAAGPFGSLSWFKPVFGSVVLVIVTLTIPVVERFFVSLPPPGGTGSTTGGASAGGTGSANNGAAPSP